MKGGELFLCPRQERDVHDVLCHLSNGETLPGSSPKYLIILSGEAKDNLPHDGSPFDVSEAFKHCSR